MDASFYSKHSHHPACHFLNCLGNWVKCVKTPVPNSGTNWSLTAGKELKANKSTAMQPCTLGNQHSHYTATTCRPVHDTISNSFNIHCVVNKLFSLPVKPQLMQGQIRTSAMENTHACSVAPWPTSFSFCTSCEKKKKWSVEPHLAAGGKWALSQVLTELYVGITWDRTKPSTKTSYFPPESDSPA